WGYERTTVIASGKAIDLYDSSVSLHNENELYSDKANTLDTTGRDIAAGGYDSKPWQPWVDSMFSNQKDITNPNIPDKWDTADSPYRYYGAGLIALNGSDLTIKVDIKRDDAPKEVTHLWDNQWFNIGTVIPETPGSVTPPEIHYNHTNVALEKPTPTEVTYHYDTIMPATIPGGTPISYHYNEISVPIPSPTKKADKEGKTLIAGDESTQHISQYTGVNQKLDKFAVGDAIQYTNDGRLPVSFDLSKWTVTTSNGANVTAQGKFTQYDKTF